MGLIIFGYFLEERLKCWEKPADALHRLKKYFIMKVARNPWEMTTLYYWEVVVMKYSRQREMIFNYVKKEESHMTADTIYEFLKKDNPTLSLGTVYRNLNQLTEHNLIQKISFPGHPDRFDAKTQKHFHFCCSFCHQIKDLILQDFSMIAQMAEQLEDVDIHHIDLSFHGACGHCRQAEAVS